MRQEKRPAGEVYPVTFDRVRRHRRPARLQDFDYATAGAYFVTLVTKNRECHYGQVTGGKMRLNAAGRVVDFWWRELPNKFPQVILDYYVTMPNHLHGIIWIVESGTTAGDLGAVIMGAYDPADAGTVGADLRVGPDTADTEDPDQFDHDPHHTGAHTGAPLPRDPAGTDAVGADLRVGSDTADTDNPPDLSQVIQWFKTMTTNAYIRGVKNDGWRPFPGKLWQRSFHDRIIRSRSELDRIRRYIANNPANWSVDRENPTASGRTWSRP